MGKGKSWSNNRNEQYPEQGGGFQRDNRMSSVSDHGSQRYAPLNWVEVKRFSMNECHVILKEAKLENGTKRRSIALERDGRERPSHFFRDTDLIDLIDLLTDADEFCKSARGQRE
jgi:hypothetical protein